jgi:hypothetical protein
MSSQTEGRVCLALQAYNSNYIISLRAAADLYDVPFATLYDRHTGVPSRQTITANSRIFDNNEEELLVRKILQLSAEGFPP